MLNINQPLQCVCRLACGVLEKLQSDAKDDLYFAGGRDRLTFRNLLASGHLPQALLARCVDLSTSAMGGAGPAMDMWEEILTGTLKLQRKAACVLATMTL